MRVNAHNVYTCSSRLLCENILVMQSANAIGNGGGGSYTTGGTGTGSRTRDLGLRAQKKLLGRIVSTGAGRSLFIDDATTSLLDNLYKLMENIAKSNPHLDKKEPEKVLKNIVKLSIKVPKTLQIPSFNFSWYIPRV